MSYRCRMQTLGRASLLWTVVILGCPSTAPQAPAKPAPKAASEAAAQPKAPDPAPEPVPPKPQEPMGTVLPSAPIALASFLGAAPAEAEAQLGEPQAKGGAKDSCVRFLPDKTWFRCKHVWQRYADKTGTAETIHVTYEDGKAASIAFEKLAGEGAFDPRVALTSVGLQLPGEPTVKQPADNVTLWSWWNAQARLLVGGRQYRVEVSAVDGQWTTAKVDIILNDPLDEDEKTRVFEVVPQRGPDAGGSGPEAG